jgi:V/A-type H+-transporting ATPase subunit B
MYIEHLRLHEVRGNIIILEGVNHALYDEIAVITLPQNIQKTGRVIQLYGDKAVVLVFEGTQDFSLTNSSVHFTGKPMLLNLSRDILGRTFNGMGQPKDNLGAVYAQVQRNINGTYINPVQRDYPCRPIQTGFSAIDGLATLMRGQKLPIFSADGLPHDLLAAQIAAQYIKGMGENAAIVFAAMGVKLDTAQFFNRQFEENGAGEKSVLFLNLANDPPAERLITPRCALTAAQYLAFDCDMDVLVILTDMTAYAEAGRNPGAQGLPGLFVFRLGIAF